jgi:hypothetical protein
MLQIKVHTAKCLTELTETKERHIPFAVSRALNLLANDAQNAEREHIQANFKVRRPWVLQGVYISKADRATKTSWAVTIQIQGDRDFLNRFERGDTKFPLHGKWLWLPNRDVFGDQVISRSNPLHPKNLHFEPDPKGGEMQGNSRTFMVHGTGKRGPLVLQRMSSSGKGVTQRIGEGFRTGPAGRNTSSGRFTNGEASKHMRRGGVRMLYVLISRAKIPVRLKFVETITSTVESQWSSRLTESISYALNTAR